VINGNVAHENGSGVLHVVLTCFIFVNVACRATCARVIRFLWLFLVFSPVVICLHLLVSYHLIAVVYSLLWYGQCFDL